MVVFALFFLVALNFQTPGMEMDLYQGRFQDNGFSGYILKPAFLQDPTSKFNPRAVTEGPWWNPKKVRVRVGGLCEELGLGAALPSPALSSQGTFPPGQAPCLGLSPSDYH